MPDETPDVLKPKKPPGFFKRVGQWFKRQAEWVVDTFGDEEIEREIREDLGLNPDSPLPKTELAALPNFAKDLDPEVESFSEVTAEIEQTLGALLAVADAAKNDQLSAWDTMFFLGTFSANESIRLRAPFFYALGQLAVILRDDPEELGRLDPGRLVQLLRGEGPGPGGAELFHQRLFASLPVLMEALAYGLAKVDVDKESTGLDLEWYYGWDPAPGSPTPESDLVSMRAVTMLMSATAAPSAKLAMTVVSVPRTTGGAGIFLSFGGSLTADTVVEGTRYRITTGGSGAFDLFIPLGTNARALEGGGDPEAFVRIEATRSDPNVPALRIGEANRTRLDVGAMKLGLEMSAKAGAVTVALENVELILKLDEGDGFLKNLSDKELPIRFNLGLILDSEEGFRLDGGSRAEVTVPVANSVLGNRLTVHHIDLRLGKGKQPEDFALEASVALTTHLGPFTATVDRVGLQFEGGFREGNLGIADLTGGFRFPNGIGLVLYTDCVRGGGYLFLDKARGEYAGILEVKLGPVNIKAIGILQTAKDGRDDWSLLLFLFGQFEPIQLIGAFNLSGAGGMIGVRRAADVAKLQAGVRLGALDDLLFPEKPVADAPRLINQLRTMFPYAPGALTLGPFLEVGFGRPQVVIVRVGVIFQADRVDPGSTDRDLTRVLVLGQVRVEVPPKVDKKVAKLIFDIFGVIDLQAKSVLFSGRLRDSKIATFTLTGMIVVRKDYGDEEKGESNLFVLSAGGFHPDFKDVPPGLPAPIDRLGISAIKIKGFKLDITCYFAITPNAKHFGFSGSVKGSLGPASIEASLSVDAIVHEEPYDHFVANLKLTIRLKYKGRTLAGVKVDARLEGPGYWRFSGKVVFEILWWEIELPFDEDCGEKPILFDPDVNLGEVVQAALQSADAWEAQLPAGGEAMVTIANAGAAGAFAHPLATLRVTQNVVPLGVAVQRFGRSRVTGPNRFDVTAVRVGGTTLTSPPTVTQPFARGQFFDLTDEQRLTLPSFEPFAAGVSVTGSAYTFGTPVTADVKYETAYLDMEPEAPRGTVVRTILTAATLPTAALEWQAARGAAARSLMRERATAPAGAMLNVAVQAPALVAVDALTLAPSAAVVLDGQAATSPTIALQKVAAAGAALTVVEAFEVD
jgi:hypothetical protein